MSILGAFLKKKEQPLGVVRVFSGSVVAKRLSVNDADEYMYEDNRHRIDCCPTCHNTLSKIPNKDAEISIKRWDIACTYDGYIVVSDKFRLFCKHRHYPDLTFSPLPKSNGLYFFEPKGIFELDYEQYGTKYINKRDCCGTYDEIIGPPVIKSKDFLVNKSNDFIMKAKYYFGSYEKKGVVIIVGTETANIMKAAGLKGIYFHDIYDYEGLIITEKLINGNVLG
jgi:hypothetical protein